MKKRSKRSRLRGRKTAGWGCKKKRRGKGSRGGKGMAGTGKKAGQKITWLLRYHPDYLGKNGFTSLKQKYVKRERTINIGQISERLDVFLKQGAAKKIDGGTVIELHGYKILSQGQLGVALTIKADSFSEKAIKKIEQAGGKAVVTADNEK